MSQDARKSCVRTDAVLAVHLDGDLWPADDDRASIGYAFVSDDSLHEHLRGCGTCQLALQRARRLDAALASTAGRDLAQHGPAEDLGARLLQRAAAAARAADAPRAPVEAAARAGVGAWLGGGLVAAAAAVTLYLLAAADSNTDPTADPTADLTAGPRTSTDEAARRTAPPRRDGVAAGRAATREPDDAQAPRVDAPTTASSLPAASPAAQAASARLPRSLASRLRSERRRGAPAAGQRARTDAELAAQVAQRELDAAARLAAAEQLAVRTRAGSANARRAFDELVVALSACGDQSEREVFAHAALLDAVRARTPLLVRLEHRLAELCSGRGDALGRRGEAAVLVAARVGTARLDVAVRRVLRRRPAAAASVAAALRCGARVDGAAALLLGCWHDQIALGNQENAPRWATFWFAHQAETTFDQLPAELRSERTAAARERCLLAMGAVPDDSTVALLLARLASPRYSEACAAACAVAMLPHRALEPLTRTAKGHDQSLLRAALARAGLPAARPWVRALGLDARQRELLRSATLQRFPEVAAWFRNGHALGD